MFKKSINFLSDIIDSMPNFVKAILALILIVKGVILIVGLEVVGTLSIINLF